MGQFNETVMADIGYEADKDGDKKLNYAEFSSMLQDPYSRLEDLYGVTGGDGRPAGGEAKFKQPDIENPLADEVQSWIYFLLGI